MNSIFRFYIKKIIMSSIVLSAVILKTLNLFFLQKNYIYLNTTWCFFFFCIFYFLFYTTINYKKQLFNLYTYDHILLKSYLFQTSKGLSVHTIDSILRVQIPYIKEFLILHSQCISFHCVLGLIT